MWLSSKPGTHANPTRHVVGWLALAICLAYANGITAPFQFDDYNVIVHYAGVHSWQAWSDGIGHGIRTLLKASYTFDWMLGYGAVGFHITNLLIHLLNGWLAYRLSYHYCKCHPALPTGLPLAVALLFVLHPVHSEAVTYISGRSSSMMTLFYLGGLLCYTHGRQLQSGLYLYFITPLCFIAALLCKESAVTFPFALLLWEWFALEKREGILKAQSMSWAMLLLASILFLFLASYQSMMENSAYLNTLGGNLATQTTGLLWLLRQWLLPLWLNIDPDLPFYRGVCDAPLAILATSGLALVAWLQRHDRPWLTFAIAWAMLQLLSLYLFMPRVDIANERQLYIAGWPLVLAFIIELTRWFQLQQVHVIVAALLMCAALLTQQRNYDYRSETALWEATVRHSPNKSRVHNNLGYAYLVEGRSDDARREFEIALQLNPENRDASDNLLRIK